jgi:hypothetical protein
MASMQLAEIERFPQVAMESRSQRPLAVRFAGVSGEGDRQQVEDPAGWTGWS